MTPKSIGRGFCGIIFAHTRISVMEHIDDLNPTSPLMNVQIHEIKPSNKSNSFAALLEKFFLNMDEERKTVVQARLDDGIMPAQSLITPKAK